MGRRPWLSQAAGHCHSQAIKSKDIGRCCSPQRKEQKTGYTEGCQATTRNACGFPHSYNQERTVSNFRETLSPSLQKKASTKNKELAISRFPPPSGQICLCREKSTLLALPFQKQQRKGCQSAASRQAEHVRPADRLSTQPQSFGHGHAAAKGCCPMLDSNFPRVEQEVVVILQPQHHTCEVHYSKGWRLPRHSSMSWLQQLTAICNKPQQWPLTLITFSSVPTIQNSFVTEPVRQATDMFQKSN